MPIDSLGNRAILFSNFLQRISRMATPTTQMPIDYKGKRYAGIYSVSGTLLIARIPGISSRSGEVGEDESATAQALLSAILDEADRAGRL